MRIFDNPNHPHYGPVRRLWIILTQLDLLDHAEALSRSDLKWDTALSRMIVQGVRESEAQRALVHLALMKLEGPMGRKKK